MPETVTSFDLFIHIHASSKVPVCSERFQNYSILGPLSGPSLSIPAITGEDFQLTRCYNPLDYDEKMTILCPEIQIKEIEQ